MILFASSCCIAALIQIKQRVRSVPAYLVSGADADADANFQGENDMRDHLRRTIQAAVAALLVSACLTTIVKAETGAVRVLFTKGGFIVLTFRGHHYPFTVSGMSMAPRLGLRPPSSWGVR